MNTVIPTKTAFTLIELIVSLTLVSVVVLGIFAINVVLNNNNQDYGQRYLVRSETQTALNHILNDASLAVGSGTNVGNPSVLDQGIVIWSSGANENFCMHQNPTGAPGGDIWACYEWDNTSGDGTYKQIWSCTMPYTLNPSTNNRGALTANCSGTGSFLGTAYNVTNPVNGLIGPYYSPSTNPTIGFSITIQNCLNDSASTCNAGGNGISSDPVNNPEVQVSGSVVPSQEGTG